MPHNKYRVATVINYCTNDYKFIGYCIAEAGAFSAQVIVPVCDHFLDGTPENRELLNKTYMENQTRATFVEYKYDLRVFTDLRYNAVHGFSRLVGLNNTHDDIEYLLFIDADEIIEGDRFQQFLNAADIEQYNVVSFANYYYFRDVRFRAKALEDSILLVRKTALTPAVILHEHDRFGIIKLTPGDKIRGVLGLDNKPLAHHYSWVRTKDEMLTKVRTFGHKADLDWVSLIEEEFTHEFDGKDFMHDYEYETVEPYIAIDMDRGR